MSTSERTEESSYREIVFDAAWKDFLVVRSISHKISLVLHFTADKTIQSFALGPFVQGEIDGRQYLIDTGASKDIPLVYPLEAVMAEIDTKITRPLRGKMLGEKEMLSLRGKSQATMQKIDTRLGGAIRAEVGNLIQTKNYWEALFSIHQILEHRLHRLLVYKSAKMEVPSNKITIDRAKERICNSIRSFKHLIELTYLTSAVDEQTMLRLTSFDKERDNVTHKLLTMEIPSDDLKSLCDRGLALMDDLETSLSSIIPKPRFVSMTLVLPEASP